MLSKRPAPALLRKNCWNEDYRTTGVWDSSSVEQFSDWPGIPLWGCQKWAHECGNFKSTRHGCKRGRVYRMRKTNHGWKCYLLVALDLLLLHGLLSLTTLALSLGTRFSSSSATSFCLVLLVTIPPQPGPLSWIRPLKSQQKYQQASFSSSDTNCLQS